MKFRAGDMVELKSPGEIANTLDADGMLDGLPFMPEMVELFGRSLRVARPAEKVCVEYAGGQYKLREFREDNVVVLEGPRCPGASHDGCQRACVMFWKTAWLRKVEKGRSTAVDVSAVESLRQRLKTRTASGRYVCQSTEMAKATQPLPRMRILLKCFREIRSGSRGVGEMTRLVLVPLWRKATRWFPRPRLMGNLKRTPVSHLGLQPGEWVTIKSVDEIAETLDARGRNRGLICDHGMCQYSGGQYQVRNRLDQMIAEPTGEMRKVESTVILEGLKCFCWNVVGGCPRDDFMYWREVWLERVVARETRK